MSKTTMMTTTTATSSTATTTTITMMSTIKPKEIQDERQQIAKRIIKLHTWKERLLGLFNKKEPKVLKCGTTKIKQMK